MSSSEIRSLPANLPFNVAVTCFRWCAVSALAAADEHTGSTHLQSRGALLYCAAKRRGWSSELCTQVANSVVKFPTACDIQDIA
jgi:hypothetical protein